MGGNCFCTNDLYCALCEREWNSWVEKMNSKSIYILIPAYNESKVIGEVLEALIPYEYSVVVVDDGSKDNTFEVARIFPIHLLSHKCNLGQGAAIQTGIEYALQQNEMQVIVTFDADGQHLPEDIARVVEPIEKGQADVVLGSRFLNPDGVKEIPRGKYTILKLATLFTRVSTKLKITDTHNGFRAFSREAAKRIKITQNGMSHASELLSQIQKKHLSYCEIPVMIVYSEYSKQKGQSAWNAINILWDSFFEGLR